MSVIHITDVQLYDLLFDNNSGPVVIRYTAKWCAPCKHMHQPYEDLSVKYPNVKFVCIDIEDCDGIRAPIKSLPTFLFLNNGVELDKFSKVDISEVEKAINACF